MNKRCFFLALLLVAASMTACAQGFRVWQNGKAVYYELSTVDSIAFDESSAINGREWVDLGLPSGTLWATMNVGANAPEELGNYFAWGETAQKNDDEFYWWGNYLFGRDFDQYSGSVYLTKYCTDSSYGRNGFTDGLTELLPEDDAATVNWDSFWQLPSSGQLGELFDEEYTWAEEVTQNGVNGLLITSKSNGKSIFLPAAGMHYIQSYNVVMDGRRGYYWSRSLGTSPNLAWSIVFGVSDNSYFGIDNSDNARYLGMSARPVRVQRTPYPFLVTSISLSRTELTLTAGRKQWLSPNIKPSYANRELAWESSDESVATYNDGYVTAVAEGTCTITCRTTDGSNLSAQCQVTVLPRPHEYVDLGLPSGTLWAAYNVGANAPQERGDHFAWGETAPKQDYTWETYRYSGNTQNTLTKYCTNSAYGTVDNKTELLPEDDAATVNWGSDWQMPSRLQMEELLDTVNNTKIETVEVEGVRCRKITSRRNGRSIYIPAAGARFPNSDGFYNDNITGYYWSRTLNTNEPYNAHLYNFLYNSKRNWINSYSRNAGFTVRAVRKSPMQYVTSIQMDATAVVDLSVTRFKQLTATVVPSNATNQVLLWSSSDESIAKVDNKGMVEAFATGTCTIKCRATDGSGVKAQCQLSVRKIKGTTDGHEWVDLGLPSGTLWATCNVGTHYPEGYGYYFAWGETELKGDYRWSTYKWGDYTSLTKYCTKDTYGYGGFTDDLSELLPEDDVATANWGNNWQMPSISQILEILESAYTTTEWTTQNGVKGELITSRSNGNSIFLPAAGKRYLDEGIIEAGSSCVYWSRSLDKSEPYKAYNLVFAPQLVGVVSVERIYGYSVRPVLKK